MNYQRIRVGDQTRKLQTHQIEGQQWIYFADIKEVFQIQTNNFTLHIDDVYLSPIRDEQGQPKRIQAHLHDIIDIDLSSSTTTAVLPPSNLIDREFMEQRFAALEGLGKQTYENTVVIIRKIEQLLTQTYELAEYNIPRLFIVLPDQRFKFKPINSLSELVQIQYRLYFLCECSTNEGDLHLAFHNGYVIRQPTEFFSLYAPYLRTMIRVVKGAIMVAGFALPQISGLTNTIQVPDILKGKTAFEFITQGLDQIDQTLNSIKDTTSAELMKGFTSSSSSLYCLEGAELRQLEYYLEISDKQRSYGNLYRVTTSDQGHVRWVCIQHYKKNYFDKQIEKFVTEIESIGGSYDQKTSLVSFRDMDLSSKMVKRVCEMLSSGFNIYRLVVPCNKISERDLDKLVNIVVNGSSVRSLYLHPWLVNIFGRVKYG
ncbi:unnamed protein product, partial [Didymodactylos carnosus]